MGDVDDEFARIVSSNAMRRAPGAVAILPPGGLGQGQPTRVRPGQSMSHPDDVDAVENAARDFAVS